MKKSLSVPGIIILIVLCLFAFTSLGDSLAGSSETGEKSKKN